MTSKQHSERKICTGQNILPSNSIGHIKGSESAINEFVSKQSSSNITRQCNVQMHVKNKSCNNNSKSTVVNLSNHKLSISQLSLLERGLKFCPTPGEPHMANLRRDLDRFHRRLKWNVFFSNREGPSVTNNDSESADTTNPNPPFQSRKFNDPSTAEPNQNPTALEAFIIMNELKLAKLKPTAPSKNNLSKLEKKAITELKNNPDIVIKPADKGGAVVILNTQDYIKEAERQLADPNFYKNMGEQDDTKHHNLEIRQAMYQLCLQDEISFKVAKYLVLEQPRTAQLYLLPKIHKNISPPPGRPVVSANDCPTERISTFVDYFLKPLIPETQSYIKDTTHFLQLLGKMGHLPEGTFLVTLDVTSLYTNIPHREAEVAAYKLLKKHRKKGEKPGNASLIRLLHLVLTCNNFQFNGTNYLQVGGTAMGTRVAPSLANAFMDDFEHKYVYTYPTQPILWKRYIDDVFCIWTGTEDELKEFIQHLNGCHNSIKFTADFSQNSVNFLDTTVFIQDNNIHTDVYTKETDTHSYLRYESAHTPSCKKGIPYGQFLRIRRICQTTELYNHRSETMIEHFVKQGYPLNIILEARDKAGLIPRTNLLDKPTKPKEDDKEILVMVTTFQPGFSGLKDTIQSNWDLLKKSIATKELSEKRVIFGYRRPKNLRDMLVRAKLNHTQPARKRQNTGSISTTPLNECKRKNCRYCPNLDKSGRIKCTYTGREYMAKYNVTCKSNNLIYCITCKRCGLQYVGQTKRRLMDRFQNHYWITQKNDPTSDIASHFNSNGHEGIKDIQIHILDFIYLHPDSEAGCTIRDQIELNWIHRMHTSQPYGLNIQDHTTPVNTRISRNWTTYKEN